MTHEALPTTIVDFASAQMDRLQVPGVSIGIWHEGTEFAGALGVTNVDHPLPVTTQTLFQIGSTSKTFTATAMMILAEQGKLDWDAPVRKYLPEFRLQSEEDAARARVWHLVTHVGGWVGDYFRDTGRGDDALANMMLKLANSAQLTPCGDVFSYNNAAFYIAGRVIEVVTGEPFEAAVGRLVFEPLGLKNTFFSQDDLVPYGCAVGHLVTAEGPRVTRPWRMSASAAPAGGIVSNVHDQLAYARFHLGDGHSESGAQILAAASLADMKRKRVDAGSMCDAFGLSWMLKQYGSLALVQHGGATNGQMSAFVTVPAGNFADTILTNADRGRELHDRTIEAILEHFLGEPIPRPVLLDTSAGSLSEYAGVYIPVGSEHHITVDDDGLVLQTHPGPAMLADGQVKALPPSPISLRFYDNDRVIGVSTAGLRSKGEFLRSPGGEIEWFRWGGRIARKQATDA